MTLQRWWVCLILLLGLVGHGQAQVAKLPPAITGATSALNADDRKAIEDLVDDLVRKLINGTDALVMQAREGLIDPLRTAGENPNFAPVYSAIASSRLGPALKSSRPMVRLNAMVVVSYLSDVGVVPLILEALQDSAPGVRYWAARVVTQVSLPDEAQRQVLEALNAAIKKESSRLVVAMELVAMSSLTTPEAKTRVVDVLNRRAADHIKDPRLSPQAELAALDTLFARLATLVRDENIPPAAHDTAKATARSAYLYLRVAAAVLRNPPNDRDLVREYDKLAENTERGLSWVARKLAPGVTLPASVRSDIVGRRWAPVDVGLEEWKALLQKPPFNFTPAELEPK